MARLTFGLVKPSEAAEILGVSRWTINRRCKTIGLDPDAARKLHVGRLIVRAVREKWRWPAVEAVFDKPTKEPKWLTPQRT